MLDGYSNRLYILSKQKTTGKYHHGDLRNALILVAMQVLNEQGMSALSMRELARLTGVGHNAPYRHFKNKAELLEAVASMGFRQLKALNLRLELEFANDPETQLFESGAHILKIATKQPELFNLMFGGRISLHDCGEELKQESEASLQSLIKIIANGQKQEVFAKEDLFKQTLAAMSMVHGFSAMVSSGMLQEVAQCDQRLKALMLQVFDVLIHGLKKR